jgi:hypothetical protein
VDWKEEERLILGTLTSLLGTGLWFEPGQDPSPWAPLQVPPRLQGLTDCCVDTREQGRPGVPASLCHHLDSLGWGICFHHLDGPPGFWSQALNLLGCQASRSVTFRLRSALTFQSEPPALGFCIMWRCPPVPAAAVLVGGCPAVQMPAFPLSCCERHGPSSVGRGTVGEPSSSPLSKLSAPTGPNRGSRPRLSKVLRNLHPWGHCHMVSAVASEMGYQ